MKWPRRSRERQNGKQPAATLSDFAAFQLRRASRLRSAVRAVPEAGQQWLLGGLLLWMLPITLIVLVWRNARLSWVVGWFALECLLFWFRRRNAHRMQAAAARARELAKSGQYESAALEMFEVLRRMRWLSPLRAPLAPVLKFISEQFRQAEKFPEAERWLRGSLALHVSPSRETAVELNNLAALCERQDREEEVEPLLREAYAIWGDSASACFDYGMTLTNLGHCCQRQGRLEEARQWFMRALDVYERSEEPEDAVIAVQLNILGELCLTLGRYADAELYLQRGLALGQKRFGGQHLVTAALLENSASLHRTRRELESAEELLRQSMQIRRKSLGVSHPAIAANLNDLAQLRAAQGQMESAEALYASALVVLQQTLGLDHPHAAVVMENYAALIDHRGQDLHH